MAYFTFTFTFRSLAYCIRIILGCIIVWWSLYYLHDEKKIWAMISVIVVSDTDFMIIKTTTISRVVNTLTGCLLGIASVYLTKPSFWSLIPAIAISVIISTSFKNYPSSWKLAPATVVIVMTPTIIEKVSSNAAVLIALARTGEIIYGCFVALFLGYLFSLINRKIRIPFLQEKLLAAEKKAQD